MGSLTKQPSRLFNPKLLLEHFLKGDITCPSAQSAQSSSQKRPRQGFRPENRESVGSNGSSSGCIENQPESGIPHEDDYQHHETSDEIWGIFKSDPGETKEDLKPLLQKKQCPTFLSPAEIQSLQQPSPPPNKPLPKIPTQAKPQTTPQRVLREAKDQGVPLHPQNAQPQVPKTGATYSPFPKLVVSSPSTKSVTHSSRQSQETRRLPKLPRPNSAASNQAHQHTTKLYDHLSREKEQPNEEFHEEAVEKLFDQVVRNPPAQNSVTGSCGGNSFRPLGEVIMRTEAKITRPSPRNPSGSALFFPPAGHDWGEDTPILFRLSSQRDRQPKASPEAPPKAATLASQPTLAAPEAYPKTARNPDRRPTRAPLESGTKTYSLESQPTATSETSPKSSPRDRLVPIVSTASRSATNLAMHSSEPRLVLTKKSAPNLRRAAKLDPLQLPPLPQPPWPDTAVRPCFDHNNHENYRLFGFLRIHRRGSSEDYRSGKKKSLSFRWCRFNTD
ncbi:hypothetical protein EDB81DRAFT_884773 [Dactylonectria macrodidyma]|uniref:Uncharacterized protein n=1 Tax=Dactylonectria macrodidyma TaxID=307937 RepID=A0A9P9IZJ2_9HYPO|nr:hypothetical protein EDB81DRAFT_884773 [Dactylonectria macrodidyma]